MHHTNNATTTHHGAADGALAGGRMSSLFAFELGGLGHTGRDAVLGAGAGHIAENHHESHARAHNQHAHHTGGLAAGQPGTATTTTTTTVPKASAGDKISGKVDVLVGKMTHNPQKVAVGEVKQAEGKVGLEQRGLAGATGAHQHGVGGVGNM
ncbi:hypothetical protein P7C70_g7520, partial [Phenoliferia sp. Uapishka_3]